jgi:pimeloyl-ACP methyl ester carboxylesterase
MTNIIQLQNNIAYKYHEINPEKETIVFLHDSLGCITLWRDFPKLLGEKTGCNILMYDRLGYGKSGNFIKDSRDNFYMEDEADVLKEILTELKIEKPILFGHSDGGSIALIFAGKYPNLPKAIITVGAHIFVEDVTLKGIREAEEAYKKTNLKEKLEKYHGDKTEALFIAWTKTWQTPQFQSWNIEHFLPKIICPSLIIQGKDDEFGTLTQVEKTVAQISGKAEAFVISNAKHTPYKEVPDIDLAKCTSFIDGLS